MKTIARIVTRLQGEGDGLMLGVAMKNHNYFEPNMVYEIVEVCDALIIKKVGISAIAATGETYRDSPLHQHWASDVADILTHCGRYLYLTREEVNEMNNKRKEGNE